MPILRLFIPACLCLLTVGATTIGSQSRWAVQPIVTSTHAKNKIKNKSKPRRKTALPAGATAAAEPVATFAERLAPFAVALRTPAADQPWAAAYAAVAPSDQPAIEPRNPLVPAPAQAVTIPMRPPPGTPPSVLKRVVYRSQSEICDTLAKAGQSNNLPVPFFIRLLFQESRFDAASVSHAGAQGIAQFMPETAADVGLDNPFDPLEAIPAAARLLRDFIDKFGNLGLAAAAYNAGPTRVQKWLKRQSGLPAETRGYVKIITGQPAERWKAAKGGHGSTEVPQKAPCKEASARYAANTTAPVPLSHAPPQRYAEAVASAGVQAWLGDNTALQLAARRR